MRTGLHTQNFEDDLDMLLGGISNQKGQDPNTFYGQKSLKRVLNNQ